MPVEGFKVDVDKAVGHKFQPERVRSFYFHIYILCIYILLSLTLVKEAKERAYFLKGDSLFTFLF